MPDGTVWITQQSEGKSFGEALKFGRPVPLYPEGASMLFNTHMDVDRRLSGKYNPDTDWIVCVGAPEVIGAVCAWVGKEYGRLRLLVWDRRARDYMPAEFTI